MDIDGGNPKQLTNDGGFFPDVSPDGRWNNPVSTNGVNSAMTQNVRILRRIKNDLESGVKTVGFVSPPFGTTHKTKCFNYVDLQNLQGFEEQLRFRFVNRPQHRGASSQII